MYYLSIKDKERKKLLSKIVNDFKNTNFSIEEGVLALSFAILRSNKLIGINPQINKKSKLDVLLSEWLKKYSNQEKIINLFNQYEIPNLDDDILGAFYQSIQDIFQKSYSGAYYTPSELLGGIKIPPDKSILDPCCGSGGILLNVLTKTHDPTKIFARDIDEIAIKICYINLILFFNNKNITSNIIKHDITLSRTNELFDFIITNPPWGSKFNFKQKENLIKLYPELGTSEIFSISLYNTTKMLGKKGELYFFLPHSFLNVAAHRKIRNYIFNGKYEISIKLLGNAFKGVLSESILLHIKNNSDGSNVHIQNKEGNIYKLPIKNITSPDFIISATSKTHDSLIIEKIYKTEHITLNHDAIFALGIVTGNNKKYLIEEKIKNSEVIFRGKDIDKYTFKEPKYFIDFQPDLYQQVANIDYYRQNKIVYRFICDKIVCVLDKNNSLILNSANLLISTNYPMETIVSFFNSDIYTFIYRKKFHSRKLLKSHLQSLPLPVLPKETHQFIYCLYENAIMKRNENLVIFQRKVDEIICDVFLLNKKQYKYIKGEK